MEIYRAGNRLFMIIDAEDHYSDEAKARADAANPHVQKWIALMQRFQQPIPAAGPDGTWMEMDFIYRLTDHLDSHDIARWSHRARTRSERTQSDQQQLNPK